MNCPLCGKETIEGSDFCTFCGTDLRQTQVENTPPADFLLDNPLNRQSASITCLVCGKQLIEGSDFCTFCGTNLKIAPSVASTVYRPVPSVIPDSMKKTNGVAIAALICGIIPTIFVGFILSIVAIFLIDANRARQKGMNLAVIGGMLSVLWVFGIFFSAFYLTKKETGVDLGKTFTQSMKYGPVIEAKGALILACVPADIAQQQRIGPEALRLKLTQASEIIEKRIKDSGAAAGVVPTVGPDSLILAIPGVNDRQKVIDIVTSTDGMPLALRIVRETNKKPGAFAGYEPDKDQQLPKLNHHHR